MKNNRLYSRINISSGMPISVLDSEVSRKVYPNASLSNISNDGLCIILNNTGMLKVGDNLTLDLKLSEDSLLFNVVVKRIDAQNKTIGVEFIKDIQGSFRSLVRGFYEKERRGFFLFEVTAYLKDINVYGTGYFSRYFEWQGIVREEYFMTVKNFESLMQQGVKLITKKAWTEYKNHCFVFDKISIRIQNTNIKKYSFDMIFTYYNSRTKQIISQGGQTLVFADSRGKLIQIPEPILNVINNHQLL